MDSCEKLLDESQILSVIFALSLSSSLLHLQAPFLDVFGTLEDPSLPLTLEDREEWGDPVANPEHRLAISSYCPLSNITAQVGRKAAAVQLPQTSSDILILPPCRRR